MTDPADVPAQAPQDASHAPSQVIPLARLTGEYQVVVVPGTSKIQSLKELVAQFKANPGSVAWGGGSAGGSDHILAGMIAQASGVEPAKVNYIAYAGGGEAQAAIMGGHVAAGISGYGDRCRARWRRCPAGRDRGSAPARRWRQVRYPD